ncbi:MAG TPA: hypothetical protein VF138_10215 [Caulobacteraceae bacterium]
MGRLRTAAIALALIATPATALAERFNGQLDIYSLDAPAGWAQRKDSNSDMNFDAPGGKSNGGIFVGLQDARRSLDGEMNNFLSGGTVLESSSVTIDGQPCRSGRTQTGGGVVNTMLMCHLVVLFQEGPANLEFFLGMASRPEDVGWHSQVFWNAANSIRWGAAFATAP